MRLTLNVLRCPDAAVPESRSSNGADVAIGRGLECDWVLQDPDRVLSKRHCVLEFRGGYWGVRDTSTNGTFLNGAAEPVGRDRVAPVSDGDRLRFGNYEIELRIAADAAAASPGWSGSAPAWGEAAIGGSAGPGRPAADAFGDPFAPPPPGMGAGSLPGSSASGLPEDWDPFADDAAAPMPDHVPAASDAFVPPRAVSLPPGGGGIPEDWDPLADTPLTAPAAPPAGPATVPPSGGLPPDWDPLADLAAPMAPPPRASPPVTVPRPPPSNVAAAPMVPTAEVPPFALPEGEALRGDPAAPAIPAPIAMPARDPPPEATGDPFAEEGVPSRSIPDPESIAPAAATAPPLAHRAAAPAIDPDEALAALLRGAGITPASLHGAATPLAVFEQAGAALRAAVNGLRSLLIARADVKREFRIEQTMLRAAGNNPLKFAATDEAAMAALLTTGQQGVRSVAETVGDLTAHEVATLAATQAAAKALLGRLAPELVEEGDSGGGLFGAREKRLWESYRRLHAKVVEQFEDDFDSAFGKEFARAYEQAVARRDTDGN